MLASPSGKHLVERVVVFESGRLRCESRVIPQVVKTDGVDDGCPIRIVADGDGHPLVLAAGRVDTLRVGSVSVSLTWADFPSQRVLDDGLGGDRRTDLDLCDLDELAFARTAFVFKGGQQGNGGVHTRDGIGGPLKIARWAIGITRASRHPRQLFDIERPTHVIAPRSRQPKSRHAHHDDVRVDLDQRVVVQAELLYDPRREVLDHDVGLAG